MERFRSGSSESEDVSQLSRVPVFVFPASVAFNALDRDHLKQIITIYNPYEFTIRFRVLSTAPNLYTVVDPEGTIKPKNCVDLILRVQPLELPTESTLPLQHKFRIQIYQHATKSLIGRKDVISEIHFGNVPPSRHLSSAHLLDLGSLPSSPGDSFQQVPGFASSGNRESGSASHGFFPSGVPGAGGGHHPNYVAILTALFCIIGLMLPLSQNEGSGSSSAQASMIPSYLHLSVNQKLLVAYALGLVTMVIFRP